MNEHDDFEQSARRAAADVRGEAERISDSGAALATLLSSERPAPVASSRLIVVDERRQRRRSPWLPIPVAATTIVVVTGIVILANRGDNETIVVTTEPPQDTAPTEPEPEPELDPATDPGSSVPAAPVTLPSTTTPTAALDAVIQVPDERGQQLSRTVLATFGTGDGSGELGYESCQECEPMRPLAPVVTDDGAVFVADAHNDRWQIHRDGAWTSLPFRLGEVVTASPVVGHDGLIYASVADDHAGRSGARIVSYDPQTMDIVASYPGANPMYPTVDLVNGTIEMGGQSVHTFDAPLGRPTWNVEWQTSLVTLSLSGIRRQFQLPTDWSTNDTEVAALDDGSIALRAYARDDSGPLEYLLVRLWPDGTWATGRIATNPSTTNLDGRFSSTGYVQLEDAIVEYELPGNEPSPTVDVGTVRVADVLEKYPGAEPEELYRASFGSADDQLGRESCSECDPSVPWGPVLASDGRLIIADNYNARWITVIDGMPTATPFAADTGLVAQPVVDGLGRLYTVESEWSPGQLTGWLRVYDVADLATPIEQYPVGAPTYSLLELVDDEVLVNRRTVAAIDGSVGSRPDVAFDVPDVTVTWQGLRRTWQFPPTSLVLGGDARLADGSVLVYLNDGTGGSTVRLRPDGTATSAPFPGTASANGSNQVTTTDRIVLQLDGDQFVVRRYSLPPG